MFRIIRTLGLLTVVCLLALPALADEHADMPMDSSKMGQSMPEMGPPEEMNQVASLVGTWKVEGKVRMDPTNEEWLPHEARAVYSLILDGAALQMEYTSEMMGMTMKGFMLQTYDREIDKWRAVWVDNVAARLSLSEGGPEGDKIVMYGEDMYQGEMQKYRYVVSNMTDTSFDWAMEVSADDGQTYVPTMEVTYTKM